MALLLQCLQQLRRKTGDENWFVHSAPPWLTTQATLFPELHGNRAVELSLPQHGQLCEDVGRVVPPAPLTRR